MLASTLDFFSGRNIDPTIGWWMGIGMLALWLFLYVRADRRRRLRRYKLDR